MAQELVISLGSYTLSIAWYWIMAIIIIAISTIASIYHSNFTPALWGWIMGIILYVGADYIEPVLFGWIGYQHSNIYLFVLSLGLAIVFLLQIAILLNNIIRKGEVWA